MFWNRCGIIPFICFLAVVAVFLILNNNFDSSQNLEIFSSQPSTKVLKKLTLDQKIGQLFIIGFEGERLNNEIKALFEELHPGGVLLLQRNVKDENQLKELILSLQEISKKDTGLPLFIAVDQEGGPVSRIPWAENSPQSDIKSEEQAFLIGKERGAGLRELGVNLNFAPLLDSADPEDFIFNRTFQKNPQLAGSLASALTRGQAQSGVLAAWKHFPGYGRINFNPEDRLATLSAFPETSQFQEANNAKPEMIMTANVIYKSIDANWPFSFSPQGINALRQQIGGDYLIVSDDLSQNSLLNKYSLEEIVSRPIKSGIDILIFSGWRMPAKKGIEALKSSVNHGQVSEKEINSRVIKIINLKKQLLIIE